MKIIIDDKITELTPELLAREFCELDSTEQARFFNHIDEIASKWGSSGGGGWPMQLQYITDTEELTLAGRRVMSSIGDYSHWGLSNGKLLMQITI